MITLAVLFFLLAGVAFLPVFLVALGEYNGSFAERIEAFIGANDSLIVSIGTLALVSALALLTTFLANSSAEKREKSSQSVQTELKIAEFRKEWIGSFRDDLSRYGLLIFIPKKKAEEERERLQLEMKLNMRLNLDEPLAKELKQAMLHAKKVGSGSDDAKKNKALKRFIEAGNTFLRHEWRRLIGDIQEARMLEGDFE